MTDQVDNSTRRKALHLLANGFATQVVRAFNEDGDVWPVAVLGKWNEAAQGYDLSATGPVRRMPLPEFVHKVAELSPVVGSTATLIAFTCLAGGDVGSPEELRSLLQDQTGVRLAEVLAAMKSCVVVICTDYDEGGTVDIAQSMVLPIEDVGGHRFVRASTGKWERGTAALLDLVPRTREATETTFGPGMKPVVVN